jgi:septum formation protein
MRARLILASRSPQRRAILEQLGIEFTIVVPSVEELEAGPPDEVALENARRKAAAVAAGEPDALVLGVDTVVWAGGRVFGKPSGPGQAREMLEVLSGSVHTVISGIWLTGGDARAPDRSAAVRTSVRFRAIDDRLLAWYLQTGEWRDRAGGYAIQGRGAALVAALEGDYLNVVGLPVAALLELEPGLVG